MKEAAGSGFTKMMKVVLKNVNAGKLGTAGAVFLFITSIRLMHDMEVGIHRVWNQRNTRPFYKRLIYHWALVLAIPVFLAIYVGFTSLEQFEFVHRVIPASVSNSLVLVGTLFLVYKMVPDLQVRTRAAVISAILSSNMDTAIEPEVCMAGEIGLSGEIRPVNRIEQRIGEAEKLGFKRFILPKYNMQGLNTQKIKIELIPVRKVEEAFRALFG